MVSLPEVHINYACISLYLYIIILSHELCLWFSVVRVLHHLHNSMHIRYVHVHILYMLYDVSLVSVLPVSHDDMAWLLAIDLLLQVLVSSDKSSVASTRTKRSMIMSAHAQQERQVCMQVDVHTACSVSMRLTERRCSSNYSSLWINLHIYICVSDKFKQ